MGISKRLKAPKCPLIGNWGWLHLVIVQGWTRERPPWYFCRNSQGTGVVLVRPLMRHAGLEPPTATLTRACLRMKPENNFRAAMPNPWSYKFLSEDCEIGLCHRQLKNS